MGIPWLAEEQAVLGVSSSLAFARSFLICAVLGFSPGFVFECLMVLENVCCKGRGRLGNGFVSKRRVYCNE